MDTPEISWEQLLDPTVPIQYRETTAKVEAAMINASGPEGVRSFRLLKARQAQPRPKHIKEDR